MSRGGWSALVALVIITIGLTAGADPAPVSAQAPPPPNPNIVLINLDDADWDLLSDANLSAYFTNIDQHFRRSGLRFTNLHVADPVCGPSRGSLFRGQYPHNTGIVQNEGGWNVFYDRGFTDAEIGQWMRGSGYTTGLVGKYCHTGYPQASRAVTYHPPGWDTFHASHGGKYFEVWRTRDDQRGFGPAYPDGYRTDLEAESATAFIGQRAAEPFFLYVAPFAPHNTKDPFGMVAPRHQDLYLDVSIPMTADFNEADVSDKSPQFRALPLGSAAEVDDWNELHRNRLRAMTAVDEMVGAVLDQLTAEGVLDQTYVILTSDNGYTLGHHRDVHKRSHWDRNTRVPFFIRGPGIEPGTADHLLSHIDITATVLDLAGAPRPHLLDGRSFAPLLDDPTTVDERAWQEAILIQHVDGKRVAGVELDLRYQAVRRHSELYVEFENGDREYYDLALDPLQLQNSYAALEPARRQALATELARLRTCAGSACQGGIAVDPINTSLDPVGGTPLETRSTTLAGAASDDTAVAGLDVVVCHVSTGDYWDGERWSETHVEVPARVTAPGAVLTTWTFPIDGLRSGLHWVSARAVDADGNEDPVAPTAFFETEPDSEPPVGAVLQPTPGQSVAAASSTVTGTAVDNEAIDRVELVIQNRTLNRWWNGTDWQAAYHRVTATHTGSPADTIWTYTYPTPWQPSQMYTGVWTFDIQGNVAPPRWPKGWVFHEADGPGGG